MHSLNPQELKSKTVVWIIGVGALVLFTFSSLRHGLFRSGAWDLGIFDQVVYLISQGQTPVSSFLNVHILGDHAALILYPLSLLYKIIPDVHWLLAVQALALALGAWPIWGLARQAGLNQEQAIGLAVAYLMYPVVLTSNLFDFHPEVLAVPALLGAVWAARLGKTIWFGLAIALALSCKSVLSLTVFAMGIWLFFFEKRRLCGAIALFAGVSWYLIATKAIIPFFSANAVGDVTIGYLNGLNRYRYLGETPLKFVQNLFLRPNIILSKVISLDTLKYLGLLVLPIIWGLSPRHLSPLIGALPILALNILSIYSSQRQIDNHYSLLIIPFIFLSIISTLADNKGWLKQGRKIILFMLMILLLGLGTRLSRMDFKNSPFDWSNWQATNAAITQIQTQGSVLTTHEIAPHVTHRALVNYYGSWDGNPFFAKNLNSFEYVLLNLNHSSFMNNFKTNDSVNSFINQLKNNPGFQLTYEQHRVYLFERRS
ncbi:DUF2079 domain-containing protein [Komarekiella sp. 'clone 1']|uniref:DUF2079 domain-containing protein n=1 Tax=Komarekiella delphini-convector SJRDD-AB1 TaxID=2593771 RepID=A0AA40SX51_9NOST|nr:DUF2079 domain-containing protein [Komarekiella delphini-convector]MBD6616836.1 DUF2079 domain-containing protein [Komarekiella delphini-convector SJRDD-AB1]